jgi:hypothetical protein
MFPLALVYFAIDNRFAHPLGSALRIIDRWNCLARDGV